MRNYILRYLFDDYYHQIINVLFHEFEIGLLLDPAIIKV